MINLQAPQLSIKMISEDKTKLVFSYDRLPKGFGQSLGNAIRRTALSYIPGYAPQAFFLLGSSQFQPIPGVVETMLELGRNISRIKLKVSPNGDNPVPTELKLVYNNSFKGVLCAKDLRVSEPFDGKVEIVNGDLVLMTTGSESEVHKNLIIKCGFGINFSSSHERGKINTDGDDVESIKQRFITVNSIYTPVLNASYVIEEADARFEETLTMTIETDGSIAPAEVMGITCSMLNKYLSCFASIVAVQIPEPQPKYELGRAVDMNDGSIGDSVDNTELAQKVKAEVFGEDIKDGDSSSVTGVSFDDGSLPKKRFIEELQMESYYNNLLKMNGIDRIEQLQDLLKEDKKNPGIVDKMLSQYSGVYTSQSGKPLNLSKEYLIETLSSIGFTVFD